MQADIKQPLRWTFQCHVAKHESGRWRFILVLTTWFQWIKKWLLYYCLCDICSTHLDPLNMSACLTTLSSTDCTCQQPAHFWLERVDVRDDMRIQAKEAGASTADLFRRHTVSAQDTRRSPVPLLVKVVCVQHCTAAALCLQVLYEETTLILGWRGFHNWCMFIYTYSYSPLNSCLWTIGVFLVLQITN